MSFSVFVGLYPIQAQLYDFWVKPFDFRLRLPAKDTHCNMRQFHYMGDVTSESEDSRGRINRGKCQFHQEETNSIVLCKVMVEEYHMTSTVVQNNYELSKRMGLSTSYLLHLIGLPHRHQS